MTQTKTLTIKKVRQWGKYAEIWSKEEPSHTKDAGGEGGVSWDFACKFYEVEKAVAAAKLEDHVVNNGLRGLRIVLEKSASGLNWELRRVLPPEDMVREEVSRKLKTALSECVPAGEKPVVHWGVCDPATGEVLKSWWTERLAENGPIIVSNLEWVKAWSSPTLAEGFGLIWLGSLVAANTESEKEYLRKVLELARRERPTAVLACSEAYGDARIVRQAKDEEALT